MNYPRQPSANSNPPNLYPTIPASAYSQLPGMTHQAPQPAGYPNSAGYGGPQPGYPNSAGYGGPQPGYPSQPGYGAPQQGYPSQPGYGAPQPGYPNQSGYPNQPGYGAPQAGYGAPAQPNYSSNQNRP